ncbi:L,D-transpeptidase, partial [Candidatus Nomurabacteria bacterium]|nr:L,D-transpeptidase [Candidatus Nomurabacteria bacterium]
LPGVPWDLYFSADGAVIHGAYWHENFGEKWSHGCVNLAPETARILYQWVDVGAPVIIQD